MSKRLPVRCCLAASWTVGLQIVQGSASRTTKPQTFNVVALYMKNLLIRYILLE